MQAQSGFPAENRSFLRTLRKGLDFGLPIVGSVGILAAVLFEWAQRDTIVVSSILMIEVGIWKLATRFFPNERKYLALRAEVDLFLQRVRQLNTAALTLQEDNSPENLQVFEEIMDMMRQGVERMGAVAGKTENESHLVYMN